VRPELASQRLLLGAAGDRHGLEAELRRELNP
jgi:hypothetical protein